MAAHYGAAVLPARPRRLRDKAKVEACVLIVERWLIGRLRNRRFHSLAKLNAAIGDLLIRLNEERPIRRLGVTRRRLLEELDRPALKPLPIEPYVFAEWRVRRVGIDYHVDVFLKKVPAKGTLPYCSRFARVEETIWSEYGTLGAGCCVRAVPANMNSVSKPLPRLNPLQDTRVVL